MQTAMENIRAVPELIPDQSFDCAHSIALSYSDQLLSYQELDRKADQFAGYLTQLGMSPGGTAARGRV
jgi:non-ribosomal peptide synthetase component E (peptide arylation enzyme)